jgi:CRP/FNR family cyclic AMP-dependent transcriptional regulator
MTLKDFRMKNSQRSDTAIYPPTVRYTAGESMMQFEAANSAKVMEHVSPGKATVRHTDIVRHGTSRSAYVSVLTEADWDLLFKTGRESCFSAGEMIFRQAEPHVNSFMVLKGIVRTFYSSPDGKEITLGYWWPGEIFGGPTFVGEGTMHVWSGKAVEDSAVLALRGRDLENLCDCSPTLARFLVRALEFKLRWMSMLFQTLTTQSVSTRLAYLLVHLADSYGEKTDEGIVISHRFTHEDIASMVGATRQWISTTLGGFQRQGILTVQKRRIVIRNHARLQQFMN